MKKLLAPTIIALSLIGGAVALAQTNASSTASSTPPLPVVFPIPELGNCDSKDACRLYCDDNAHLDACMSYAQTHGLMKKDEITLAKLIRRGGGPGKCDGKEACKLYCEAGHTDECLQFGLKHQLISTTTASTTRAFQAALKEGAGPGGCSTTQECKLFCSDPAHIIECRMFAEMHGFNRVKMEIERAEGSSTRPMGSSSMERKLPPMGSTTRPNLDTKELRGKCATVEECKKLMDDIRPASSTPKMGSTTKSKEEHAPPFPTMNGNKLGPQSTIDKNKPPFKCTEAQAAEGACDQDTEDIDELGNPIPPPPPQSGSSFNPVTAVASVWGAFVNFLGL